MSNYSDKSYKELYAGTYPRTSEGVYRRLTILNNKVTKLSLRLKSLTDEIYTELEHSKPKKPKRVKK